MTNDLTREIFNKISKKKNKKMACYFQEQGILFMNDIVIEIMKQEQTNDPKKIIEGIIDWYNQETQSEQIN